MPSVAYQGEPGAYSEQAAFDCFGPDITPVGRASFDIVFDDVAAGRSDFGMVPVENSLAGSVHRNYDLLMRHNLTLIGEAIVRVSHNLITLPGERDRVAAVATTELEDAPAVAAPDQPVDRVVGQAGTEANRAGGERRPGRIAEGRHRRRGVRRRDERRPVAEVAR